MPSFDQIDGPATLAFAILTLKILHLGVKALVAAGDKMETAGLRTSEAVDKLTEKINDLVKTTDDHEKEQLRQQLEVARQQGEDMGLIKAGLGELLEHSREQRRANGSDTNHPAARREDFPRTAAQQ